MGTYLAGYAVPTGGFKGRGRLTSKQVVYVDINNHIQLLTVSTLTPWQVIDLTTLTGAPLAGSSSIAGYYWPHGDTDQVVYIDSNHHIQELYHDQSGTWQVADLTNITGAPLSDDGAISAYAYAQEGSKQVVFVDATGHIQELVTGLGGPWFFTDLTSLTGAPLAVAGGDLVGYDFPQGRAKQVV